ncbi:hypothetical protein FHX37_4196 [Haloactinospora alba]|uniref:Uncharacterized protein n=1 Tax=Haloactinospora alba TaxID=405555 RepID=A0A543N2R4_9ACTN|nr:hypothetical protein [Haloactinospora alba]TQN26102.1 hypothetical protein FHX37_4640 [Haloactinospora alba]TQN27476.1 hypothetical protein FHX37_4196 [Haloactinospora alba]
MTATIEGMATADVYPTAVRYLGATQVAAEIGVSRTAVTQALRRNPPDSASPFPEPDAFVGDTPGWAPDRLGEIRAWYATPRQGRRQSE